MSFKGPNTWVYEQMDKHPFASLVVMALAYFILIIIRTTDPNYLIPIIVGGVVYLYIAVAVSGYLSNVYLKWSEACIMAINGEWGKLSESRDISTHVTIATTMSLYGLFSLILVYNFSNPHNILFIGALLSSEYIFLTWEGRVKLRRHTPRQVMAGLLLGVVLAIPPLFSLLFLWLMGAS